jgi:hypothetical protein
MQRTVAYAAGMYLKSVLKYKFLIVDTCHHHNLGDVRIRDYFSKTKRVPEQTSLGNSEVEAYGFLYVQLQE